MLATSLTLCLGALCGAYASPPVPDRRVHITELAMRVPQVVECHVEEVVATPVVVLKQVAGPLAPDSLVAVDGGLDYLVLVRATTCPPEHRRALALQVSEQPSTGASPPQLLSQLRNREQLFEKLKFRTDPSRQ